MRPSAVRSLLISACVVPAALLVAGAQSAPPIGSAIGAAKRAAKATDGAVIAQQNGDEKVAPPKGVKGAPPTAPVTAGAAGVAGKADPKAIPGIAPLTREVFDYDRSGRRDPFVSLLASGDLRPALADLRLVGVLYDMSGKRPVAIMRDLTTKQQYRALIGQLVGRMRVVMIKPRAVIFSIEEFGFNRRDSLVMGDTSKVRIP
ncbi:MAG: hypothetical protein JWO05_3731 [Gemmatimonadetes bacterium]|nr:hypothetical protein [Gemmatimonadota bacterium]